MSMPPASPLAVDLFCGLGGWTDGLLAEGYDVIGFDIERHEYWVPEETGGEDGGRKGTKPVANRGWTQGCAVSLGMEGAAAAPRTRKLAYPAQLVVQDVLTLDGAQFRDADLIVASPPCQEYSYMAMPWSRAKQIARALQGEGEFPEGYTGSRTLDDLNRLFNACFRIQDEACKAAGRHIPLVVENVRGAQPWVGRARWNFGSFYLWGDVPALMPPVVSAQKFNPDGTDHGQGSWFAVADSKNRGARKNPGFRFDGSGRSFQTESVNNAGVKQGGDWFNSEQPSISRRTGSKSPARKAASAMIAKIPEPLSRHIATTYYPRGE